MPEQGSGHDCAKGWCSHRYASAARRSRPGDGVLFHQRVHDGFMWRALEVQPVPGLAFAGCAQCGGYPLAGQVMGEGDDFQAGQAERLEAEQNCLLRCMARHSAPGVGRTDPIPDVSDPVGLGDVVDARTAAYIDGASDGSKRRMRYSLEIFPVASGSVGAICILGSSPIGRL